MKKVSIIIPVYNIHQYVERCLNSIIKQTYTDLEIICIDDGSTDGTENILDRYASKDSRIIVVHQSNRGQGYARNVGLELSTGEYIGFVDGDDWIAPDMYEKLVSLAEEKKVQLVASPYWMVTDQEKKYMGNSHSVSQDVFGKNELLHYVFLRDKYRGFTSYIVCKLFRRDILKDGDRLLHKFDESVNLGEDILFFTQVACGVSSAAYLDSAFYYYWQRSNSVVHSGDLEVWLGLLKVYERVIDCLREVGIGEDVINYAMRFQGYWACVITERANAQCEISIMDQSLAVMKKRKEIYEWTNREYPDRIELFNRILSEGESVVKAERG